ncbi:MAG TPA: hypothetical protein EYG38_04205, partial [Verrucomicrobia bacterium]|nr:hypothetical protein [Verrucomicrobiota bacterium]
MGKTFFSLPGGPAESFLGRPIHTLEGWNVLECHDAFQKIVDNIRKTRFPQIIVLKTERLANHTNADDQSIYRSEEEVELATRRADPISKLREHLLKTGKTEADLSQIDQEIHKSIADIAESVIKEQDPAPCRNAKASLPESLTLKANWNRGTQNGSQITMLEAIRKILHEKLKSDPTVFLYGQDIEDPKGDVFGITRGLSTDYPERVRNAPLSESTILGTSIGRALAGEKPVAFLQFADFLPLAYNQLISEMGSMYWRTNGDWQCPVLLMMPCGGYRPGLGPFHAQSFESVIAHTPGIDVCMPSNARDAAGLLNAAFLSGRPTVYLYPKICLNDRTHTTSDDVDRQLVEFGSSRLICEGNQLTLVAWGNCVEHCRKAAKALKDVGMDCDLIDLFSLSPWDQDAVIRSVKKTGRLLVVHEDNLTCGFGAEILARVSEQIDQPFLARRLTRPDTYIPFHFQTQLTVLPSFKAVMESAAEMLGMDLTWKVTTKEASMTFEVQAIGSSPSDESVTVTEWCVKEGEEVNPGDMLAIVEADKATSEMSCPAAGQIHRLLIAAGETVKVGEPIVQITLKEPEPHRKTLHHENPGIPILTRRENQGISTKQEPSIETSHPIPTTPVSIEPPSPVSSSDWETLIVSPRQNQFAKTIHESVRQSAPATIIMTVGWDAMDTAHEEVERHQTPPIPSRLAMVSWCVIKAMMRHPRFRSRLLSDFNLNICKHANIGVAVALPQDELVTAVVKNAEELSWNQFITQYKANVQTARNGNDQVEAGPSIILSSLGGSQIQTAIPIVVPPAVATLFIGSPVASSQALSIGENNPKSTFHRSITLAMTFDHRVVNGIGASAFIHEVRSEIESFQLPTSL